MIAARAEIGKAKGFICNPVHCSLLPLPGRDGIVASLCQPDSLVNAGISDSRIKEWKRSEK